MEMETGNGLLFFWSTTIRNIRNTYFGIVDVEEW